MGTPFSTSSLREPQFPGIAGYEPLPIPMSKEQLRALPNDVLVAEIRHYLTIVEQKKEWRRNRAHTIRLLQDQKKHACTKSQHPKR